jgi:hypothetical protein
MLALKAISLQIWSDFIAKRVVRSRDSAQPFPDQYKNRLKLSVFGQFGYGFSPSSESPDYIKLFRDYRVHERDYRFFWRSNQLIPNWADSRTFKNQIDSAPIFASRRYDLFASCRTRAPR